MGIISARFCICLHKQGTPYDGAKLEDIIEITNYSLGSSTSILLGGIKNGLSGDLS
jgi:hypothetical protein